MHEPDSDPMRVADTGGMAVPERRCGECDVCCVVPLIADPALQKPAHQQCRNLVKGAGCAIYQWRPSTCRNWLCGWRLMPELEDAWRPDRSGVLLFPETSSLPGYRTMGFKFHVASPAVLAAAPVLNRLCGLIAATTPVWLAVGRHPTKIFLNPVLAPLIAAGDAAAISATLVLQVRALTAPPPI